MRIRRILASLRASGITFAVIGVVSAALIGTTFLIHSQWGTPLGDLTRDPATILNFPIYIGFLSQVGILLWAAAAAICLYSGAVLWRHPNDNAVARFLVCSGALTVMLGLDDAFLGHERIAPRLGIPEVWLYAGYAGATVIVLVVFSPVIAKTEYLVLGATIGFFAASVALDVFPPAISQRFVLEDTLKLAGIVGWLVYFSRTALNATRMSRRGQRTPPA